MSRYIDADLIEYEPMCRARGNGMYEDCEIAYKDQIDDMPSAQPERKTGRWFNDIRYSGWTCTNCHYHDGNKTDRYCPNCGAQMKGERHDMR